MDFFYVAYLKTKWRNSFKTKFSFNTSFMGKMQFFHGEVSTWEIVIWEISFGKLPHGKLLLGKLPLGKYLFEST